MMAAERAWPTSCYSFVVLGASGPASMAGALALSNAERLACLTLMWLWGEVGGYPEGHVDDPCMIEPRTLATSFGHPNLTTLTIANNQLAWFYGLEPGGGLALSDAKGIDFQSGYERGMGAVFSVLAGGSIGNSGIVGPDEAISLEQLVVDDAALSAVNWIMQGVEVSDESLALDVVKEVGIGGNYLDQVHTVEYLRQEYWESPIFTRQSWSGWERGGRKTLLERAHQEVERILAQGYPPEPLLPEGAARRLDEIVGRAWAELVA
jgi:trimethylamine--corrinoid protein Co-methyltransferase